MPMMYGRGCVYCKGTGRVTGKGGETFICVMCAPSPSLLPKFRVNPVPTPQEEE
jgi:hypothetical protein